MEQVAIFLSVIAHHKKNCVIKHDFIRSGRTISKHFHAVLRSVLRLHSILLARPSPILEGCLDPHWRWFQGCLGALDGTHVEVRVADSKKGRYRNRKGQISVNVLGVCDIESKFIYVLSGWEGSAADSRILRDAVNRPTGLKVPNGNYYLCDNRYPNGEGFLTPYQGIRYHLKEWDRGGGGPQSPQELFNLKHASARNMSLNDEEGTSKPRRCRGKTDKALTKRTWTLREEEALVNALRTIVTTGWKCENGFRCGYLSQLETLMCKQFPNSDLRAEPHINSKIHVWKKYYSSLIG
ncbi:UNVERIFIED_CONTAM: hypothetical protein Scaly_2940400 [Sesamum calycinum]|uniref:Transposase n=1 Tax=Sesamum calycinum TaxID=2727403 RepID=A0AAW2KUN4_9LAMI